MDLHTPVTEGAGFEFTLILKPLESFRENLLVLTGFAQANGRAMGDGAGDHARAGAAFLTGVHPRKTQGADARAGISADQIAAKALGQYTQLQSMELGLDPTDLAGACDGDYSCAYVNTVSWRSSRPHLAAGGDGSPRCLRCACSLDMAKAPIPQSAGLPSRAAAACSTLSARSRPAFRIWHDTVMVCPG